MDLRAEQLAQDILGKDIVGATQNQGVHLSGGLSKLAHFAGVALQQLGDALCCLAAQIQVGALLDGQRQPVAGLDGEVGLVLQVC